MNSHQNLDVAASKKTIYYGCVAISTDDLAQRVDSSLEAIAKGDSDKNIHTFLSLFKQYCFYKSKADMLKDFDNKHYLYAEIAVNPDLLGSPFHWASTHPLKKDCHLKLKKEDIISCSLTGCDLHQIIDTVVHAKTIGELQSAILVNFVYQKFFPSAFRKLTPFSTGFTLSIILKQLNDTLEKFVFNNSLESLQRLLSLMNNAFKNYRQELTRYCQHNKVNDPQEYIRLLESIEVIKSAIHYAANHIPTLNNAIIDLPMTPVTQELKALIHNSTNKANEINITAIAASKPDYHPVIPSNSVHTLKFSGRIDFEENTDLSKTPISHGVTLTADDCLILGDLHGNFLKFIYFLVHENIMTGISAEDYQSLVKIYENDNFAKANYCKIADLPAIKNALIAEVQTVRQIIKKLVPVTHTSQATIILIGDTVADRGYLDLYFFLTLEQLNTFCIYPKINISNHDRELIRLHENNLLCKFDNDNYEVYSTELSPSPRSVQNLGKLLQLGIIDYAEVFFLVEKIYQPLLEGFILNIAKTDKQLEYTFITHAPVAINIIGELINELKVDFDKKNLYRSPQKLGNAAEAVRLKIRELIQEKKLTISSPEKSALFNLMWQRQRDFRDRRSNVVLPENTLITYVHGHDGMGNTSQQLSANIFTVDLDNLLGKDKITIASDYSIFYLGNNEQFITQRKQAVFASKNGIKSIVPSLSLPVEIQVANVETATNPVIETKTEEETNEAPLLTVTDPPASELITRISEAVASPKATFINAIEVKSPALVNSFWKRIECRTNKKVLTATVGASPHRP